MESPRNSEHAKNFYIALDKPKDVFKGGDIVSGKCCLLSPVDEDLGSVTISFHGTVKVRFVDTDPHKVSGVHTLNHYEGNNHDSEDILFAETKLLYEGHYTLRKNVLYEWPFQFQFPSNSESLPPSGHFGKAHHSATVVYELEACRGRTSEDVAALKKRITPIGHDRNASMQSRTWFERIGAFRGMVATMALQVLPPKRCFIEPTTVSFESIRQFSTRSAAGHHGLSSMLHIHQKPDAGCRITVNLPKNLSHEALIPICIGLDGLSDLSVSLHAIELHLKTTTIVISNLGYHRHTEMVERVLFSLPNIGLPAQFSSNILNIGKVLDLRLDSTIIPSFAHPRLEVHHGLQFHLTLECAGQKLKEDFLIEDIQLDSDRRPNSPLRLDHVCVFLLHNQKSITGRPENMGIDEEKGNDITDAYLRVSKLLAQSFIPHTPVNIYTKEPAFILEGRPQLLEYSPDGSTYVFSQEQRSESLRNDQRLLDSILKPDLGFSATTMRTGSASPQQIGYSWVSPTAPPLSPKARIQEHQDNSTHFEISWVDPEEERPSPPYSEDDNPLSPIKILNKLLRQTVVSHANPNRVDDIMYVIDMHRYELRARRDEIDNKAALGAVAGLEMLQGPLKEVGVIIDGRF